MAVDVDLNKIEAIDALMFDEPVQSVDTGVRRGAETPAKFRVHGLLCQEWPACVDRRRELGLDLCGEKNLVSVSARFEFRVEGQVAFQFREREVRGFDREDTSCRPDTSSKPKSMGADVGSDIKDYAAGNGQLLESANRGALKRAEQISQPSRFSSWS